MISNLPNPLLPVWLNPNGWKSFENPRHVLRRLNNDGEQTSLVTSEPSAYSISCRTDGDFIEAGDTNAIIASDFSKSFADAKSPIISRKKCPLRDPKGLSQHPRAFLPGPLRSRYPPANNTGRLSSNMPGHCAGFHGISVIAITYQVNKT